MKFVHAICVFVLIVSGIVGCKDSLSDNDSALDEVPLIKPKIDFMYPEYATIDKDDPINIFIQPENFEKDKKLAPNGAIVIVLNKPVDQDTVIIGKTLKVTKVRRLEEVESIYIGNEFLTGSPTFPEENIILFTPDHTKTDQDHPDMRMDGDTVYYITIDGIKDTEGLSLNMTSSQFVTKSNIDETPPAVPGPYDKERNVKKEKEKISLYFEEPIDPKCININHVELWMDYNTFDQKPIPINVKPCFKNNAIIIKPIDDIIYYRMDYTIVLKNIQDLAGNIKIEQEISVSRSPEVVKIFETNFTNKQIDSLKLFSYDNSDFAICYTYNENISVPAGSSNTALVNYGNIIKYNKDGNLVGGTIVFNDFEEGFTGKNNLFDVMSITNDFIISYFDTKKDKDVFSVFTDNTVETNSIDDNAVAGQVAITKLSDNNFVIAYRSKKYYWWEESHLQTCSPYFEGKFKIYSGENNQEITSGFFYNEQENLQNQSSFNDDPNLQTIRFNNIDMATLINGNFVIVFNCYTWWDEVIDNMYYQYTKNEKGRFAIYSQNGDLIKAPTIFQEHFVTNDTAFDEGIRDLQVNALPNGNFVISYWGENLETDQYVGNVLIYSADGELVAAPSRLQNLNVRSIKSAPLDDNYFVTVYSDQSDQKCKLTIHSNTGNEIIDPIIFNGKNASSLLSVVRLNDNRFAVSFEDLGDGIGEGKLAIFSVD